MQHKIPELDRAGLRDFGLTTGLIIAVLFGVFFPWLIDRPWPIWPWVAFGVLGSWSLVAPNTLRPIYIGWMHFGLLLGKITTPIVMGIVFFVFVTPMGWIRKAMGKDALSREFTGSETYRVPSESIRDDYLKRPY